MADRNTNQTQDGRGNFGNSEQHAEAGRKGGEATAANHDRSFYEEIGSEGGQASSGSFEQGSERAREAGRKGGQKNNSNGSGRNR